MRSILSRITIGAGFVTAIFLMSSSLTTPAAADSYGCYGPDTHCSTLWTGNGQCGHNGDGNCACFGSGNWQTYECQE